MIKVESPAGDETRTWGPPFARGTQAVKEASDSANAKENEERTEGGSEVEYDELGRIRYRGPGTVDARGVSTYFLAANRNKRSIVIDFKKARVKQPHKHA